MKRQRERTLFVVQAALIAALYVALTWLCDLLGLASAPVQLRISEALTVLPAFTAAAVPGLGVGCLLANLLTGCAPWDVALGSLATLLGALGTRLLRRRGLWCLLPPIAANTLIVPFVLAWVYHAPGSIWMFMLTVGAGELASCGVLGGLLGAALRRCGGVRWAG